MGIVTSAIKSGNWSDSTVWSSGVVPTTGDYVYSNNNVVTVDQNTANLALLSNYSFTPTTAVPIMTSNTTPYGVVSASFTNGLTLPAYYAFNGEANNNFFQSNLTIGDYIQYDFTSSIAIDQFSIQFGGSTTVSMSLQAWNGSSWNTLQSSLCTSLSYYSSPLAGNSTLYSKYRVSFNTAVYAQIREVYFYEYGKTTSVSAGGRFQISRSGSTTITATNFDYSNNTYLNSLIYIYSSGSVSIVGNLNTQINQRRAIEYYGTGSLNIVGNLIGNTTNAVNTLYFNGYSSSLNITGDVISYYTQNCDVVAIASNYTTVNITGKLINNSTANTAIYSNNVLVVNGANSTINVVGNMENNTTLYAIEDNFITLCLNLGGTGNTLTHTGASVNTSFLGATISGLSLTNKILLTGPFQASKYGVQSIQLRRYFIIPTSGSYVRHKDNSTGGANYPGAIANNFTYYSPDTIVDAPIPANVRQGVTYALGTYTGTLAVPSPSSVSYGVATDNTTGSAVLTPQAVWDYALINLTGSGTIGARMKNVSTVESTGAQLAALL